MASYIYEDDGKIHTRWSELKRCTPGGAESVVMERFGLKAKYSNELMDFGSTRHEMWEEESRKTGRVPECFEYEMRRWGLPADMELSHIEQEIKVEIFPGIILHGQPDSASVRHQTVVDNKSITGGASQFKSSDQLLVYAFMFYRLGIRIRNGIYLCEVWSRDRERVIGYDSLKKDFSLQQLAAADKILFERCETLVAAIEVVKESTKNIYK